MLILTDKHLCVKPVKPWYAIQNMPHDKGFIIEKLINNCKCMFFNIWDVIGLYQGELKNNPLKLFGISE